MFLLLAIQILFLFPLIFYFCLQDVFFVAKIYLSINFVENQLI